MVEVFGNAWDLMVDGGEYKYSYLAITTNGTITKAGVGVMGAGIAKEAMMKCRGIEKVLAKRLLERGNIVSKLGENTKYNYTIISFPVKHNWFEDADIELIKDSCRYLMKEVIGDRDILVLLPRPGCGNGNLDWEDVKVEIGKILDDRVHIVHFSKDN